MTTRSLADFNADLITGQPQPLSAYAGQVVLVVNTASKCGYTPQFGGLQVLYDKYRERGFVVLGFPCNQFGSQDPGGDDAIADFCQRNYGVNFPMFGKIEVNGDGAHPLYKWLKSSAPGVLGTEAIKWNFTKFLLGRDGRVVERIATMTKPADMEKRIDALL